MGKGRGGRGGGTVLPDLLGREQEAVRLRDVNDYEWGCTVCEKFTYKPGGRERLQAEKESATRSRRSPTDDMV